MNDPEQILKLSKKGKTLMMFVHVAEGTPREETEEITKLWQTGLWNSHIQAERSILKLSKLLYSSGFLSILPFNLFVFCRYLIQDDRAIFLFKDGAQAWDAKNYLVEQEKCAQVVIESKAYPGPAFSEVQYSSTTKSSLNNVGTMFITDVAMSPYKSKHL